MKLLRSLANGWLLLFWADAGLGLLDELGAAVTGVHLLGGARGVTRALAWFGLPWIWLGMAATSALPLRIFAPLTAFMAWMLVGASPVTVLGMGSDWLRLGLAALQAAVALGSAALVGRPGGRWLVEVPLDAGVRWRRLAGWMVGHALVVPVLLVLYAWGSADLALRQTTGGFARLGVDGVRVVHRAYVREDRVVDLVGMIHVGDPRAYAALFEGIPVEGTLVLEEGVRDSEGRLPTGASYARLARRLGVEAQRPIADLSRLETRNADVDVGDFSEDTRKFLVKVLAIYGAEDTVAALLDYLVYVQGQPDPEAVVDAVMGDILGMRNAHLLEEIARALRDHPRVVVPWGAYHLPEIEAAILADGFQPREERTITLLPFGR